MVNRLPEKLLILRKHFGFSQQELADKMGVNVVEYMGWENGRAICNLAQFKRLATIFQISLDDMLKNSTDITLPNIGLEDSIQIPFLKGEGNESIDIPLMVQPQQSRVEPKTAQIQRVKEVEEATPQPQPVKKQQATPEKPVNTIHRIDVNAQNGKAKGKKPNKKMIGIIGGVIAIFILAVALFIFFNGKKDDGALNLRMSANNRLALADTFSVYVNDNGSVTATGRSIQFTGFQDIVQVSAHGDIAVGLKKDGTLVGTGSSSYGQLDINNIKKAIDVSVGDKHTVAVLDDGTVACVGDNSTKACDVSEWKDIVDVEAGAGFTLGIDKNGDVKVAGNLSNASAVEQQKNVSKITIGSSEIAFLNKSQTVTTLSYTGGTATDVSAFKNITQIAVGKGFVVGLGNDGKVQIATTKEDMKKIVEAWTQIGSIAANDNTILAYTTSGILVGAGDNAYSLYQNTSVSGEVEKLPAVTNIQVTQDKTKVKITWDKVTGADYYEVKVNTNPEYTAKSVEGTLSIDQSKFEDGQQYTITIIASSNTDKELNSEAATAQYTFVLATPEPTATPSYTLTINYIYDADGTTAYQQFTGTYNADESYSVKSPSISGFTPTIATVEGKIADKNVEITVRYMKTATPTPTPVPTPIPTPVVTPTPTPDESSTPQTEEQCNAVGGNWDNGVCKPKG